MLVERLTFQAKYGHTDDLVALMKEQVPAMREQAAGAGAQRIYTDATGPMFTVQFETEFATWDDYARFNVSDNETFSTREFQAWFARMMTMVDRGDRQILNVETL
jgi:hypothetical protein